MVFLLVLTFLVLAPGAHAFGAGEIPGTQHPLDNSVFDRSMLITLMLS